MPRFMKSWSSRFSPQEAHVIAEMWIPAHLLQRYEYYFYITDIVNRANAFLVPIVFTYFNTNMLCSVPVLSCFNALIKKVSWGGVIIKLMIHSPHAFVYPTVSIARQSAYWFFSCIVCIIWSYSDCRKESLLGKWYSSLNSLNAACQ